MSPYVFISYQSKDKVVAGQLQQLLSQYNIKGFLAHENISVSEEWRVHILQELVKTDVFICLLSSKYFESVWCSQESGIAAYRPNTTIIPLSLDGTLPAGFISHIQSSKINPPITIRDVIPGMVKYNFDFGVELIIRIISESRSYRGAEANFQLILPRLAHMRDEQIRELLTVSAWNDQVRGASLCAAEYLPPLLKSHGKLLKVPARKLLRQACSL